jgi:AcrR family transcriptional regulator
MSEPKRRKYSSDARKRQSDDTRKRIADAAQRLLETSGYEEMTVQDIAEAAGVATQTVYANFGSKAGILMELVDRTKFGPRYEELVRSVFETSDPAQRLRIAPKIARQIYESEHEALRMLNGGGAVSLKLSALIKQQEAHRYEMQAVMIRLLEEAGCLRPELDTTRARDILWAFTARDLFRMLVIVRGWSPDLFEQWIGDRLVEALIG